ncbi:MAG: stage II sporulation protein M [Candidatus Brockarchaeota archaeon]|nr:stage II sporulation protein M [Candidatus Brockarchaeota archaeon]
MYVPPPTESYLEFPSPPYPLSVKRASIENLLNISYWLWRLNPLSMFPVILSNAFEVLKQSIIVIAVILGLSKLTSTGILKDLADSISKFDFERMVSLVYPIIHILIPLLIATISIYYVASILAGGFLNSAEYGSYLRLVNQGTVSLKDIFEEMKVKWLKMSWTVFIIENVKIVPILIVISVIISDITYLSSSQMSKGIISPIGYRFIVWLLLLILAEIFIIIFSVLTVYAYPAAADGYYGLNAIKKSIGTFFSMPANTFLYCVLRVISNAFIGGISFAAGLLSIQISSILTIVLSFIIVPVFHIFKTTLFLKAKPENNIIPLPIGPPVFKDVFPHVLKDSINRIKKGFRELVKFLTEPRNLVFHAISALLLSLGIILGRWVSSSGIRGVIYAIGYVPGEANPLFNNVLGLPFLALDISFHNWQVSLATAFSGLVFIVPVLVTLFFNGFILGVVEDIVQNPTMFLAAILPHGIIELPAFIISGSIGLNLGLIFLNALKKKNVSSNEVFYENLKKAIYIIISLIPLFLIAGIIETFVTPLIMRIYGWS